MARFNGPAEMGDLLDVSCSFLAQAADVAGKRDLPRLRASHVRPEEGRTSMKRTTVLTLVAVVVGLLLTGGAVMAAVVNCTGGPCVGTNQRDTITGSALADDIRAGRRSDQITGGTGNDEVRAGRGNDVVLDGTNDRDQDRILGGEGNDTIDVQEFRKDDADKDFVDCGPGEDTVSVDPTDTRFNCENLKQKTQ